MGLGKLGERIGKFIKRMKDKTSAQTSGVDTPNELETEKDQTEYSSQAAGTCDSNEEQLGGLSPAETQEGPIQSEDSAYEEEEIKPVQKPDETSECGYSKTNQTSTAKVNNATDKGTESKKVNKPDETFSPADQEISPKDRIQQLEKEVADLRGENASLQEKLSLKEKMLNEMEMLFIDTLSDYQGVMTLINNNKQDIDSLHEFVYEAACEATEKERLMDEALKMVQKLEKSEANLKAIIQTLEADIRKLNEKVALSKRAQWGKKSEKVHQDYEEGMDDYDDSGIIEYEDDDPETVEEYIEVINDDGEVIRTLKPVKQDSKKKDSKDQTDSSKKGSGQKNTEKKHGGGYKGRKPEFSDLPKKVIYDIDFAKYNEEYGKYGYDIVEWSESYKIIYSRPRCYMEVTRKPVIKVLETQELIRVPNSNPALPRSYISGEFYAAMIYEKMVKAVPFYRFEAALARIGCPITRGQMIQWEEIFGGGYGYFVYEQLKFLFLLRRVHNDDETPLKIIWGSLKNSYVWMHRTSPFDPEPPIIIFSLGPSRSTEHLREFYDNWEGTFCTDSYSGYFRMVKDAAEEGREIVHALCWDHARRPFAKALNLVIDLSGEKEVPKDTLESIILEMIGEVYHAYAPLKLVTPEERKEECNTKVRPLVDKLFEVLESLDLEKMRQPVEADYDNYFDENGNRQNADFKRFPVLWKDGKNPLGKEVYLGTYPITDTLYNAVHYMIDPEKKPCFYVFLEDPFVPMTNISAEGSIRPYAIGRKNWLFNVTELGAMSQLVEHTLCETCLENKIDPYVFHLYLWENHIPNIKRIPVKDESGKIIDYEYKVIDMSKLPDMLPFSDKCRQWVAQWEEKYRNTPIPGSQTEPEAPIRELRRERAEMRKKEQEAKSKESNL